MWVIGTTTREQVIQAEQREVYRPGPSRARTDIQYPFSPSPLLYYSPSHSLYYSASAILCFFRSSRLFSSTGKVKHINIIGWTSDRNRKATMSRACWDMHSAPVSCVISPAYTVNCLVFYLFPVSIIVISVIYYDIPGCSYSYSSTRIFITHHVHMLLFTSLFLYATLFHTSLTCVWLYCLRTSLHYFLSQLVSSTTLFSRSLLYLVTGISHLVRRITTLSPAHTHCSLE